MRPTTIRSPAGTQRGLVAVSAMTVTRLPVASVGLAPPDGDTRWNVVASRGARY